MLPEWRGWGVLPAAMLAMVCGSGVLSVAYAHGNPAAGAGLSVEASAEASVEEDRTGAPSPEEDRTEEGAREEDRAEESEGDARHSRTPEPEVLIFHGRSDEALLRSWTASPAAAGLRWRLEEPATWEGALEQVADSVPVAVLAPPHSLPEGLSAALALRRSAPVYWFDGREAWEERAPHFWRLLVGTQELRRTLVAHVQEASGSGGVAIVLRDGDGWDALLADLLRDFEGSGQRVRALHWWRDRPGDTQLAAQVAHPSGEGLATTQHPWRAPPVRAHGLRGRPLAPDVVLVLAEGRDRDRILVELGELSGAGVPLVLVLDEVWSSGGGAAAGSWAGLVALEACRVVEDVEARLDALELEAAFADSPTALRKLDGLLAVAEAALDAGPGEFVFSGFCGSRMLDGSRVLKGRGVRLVEMGADGRWAPLGDGADAR